MTTRLLTAVMFTLLALASLLPPYVVAQQREPASVPVPCNAFTPQNWGRR